MTCKATVITDNQRLCLGQYTADHDGAGDHVMDNDEQMEMDGMTHGQLVRAWPRGPVCDFVVEDNLRLFFRTFSDIFGFLSLVTFHHFGFHHFISFH